MNLVISHAPSADNSNLSADGDDSFISVEMDSAMPSPFSEVRRFGTHRFRGFVEILFNDEVINRLNKCVI